MRSKLAPRVLFLAVLLSLGASFAAGECAACSFAAPEAFVAPADGTDDQVWPETPQVLVHVERGVGPGGNCMAEEVTSCDGIGLVALRLETLDNTSPPESIGYLLRVEAGSVPEGLVVPDYPLATDDGFISMHWADGSTDDQETIDFVLAVSAVDAGGNVSGAALVRVYDEGAGAGCRIVPGQGGGGAAMWTLLLGAVLGLWGMRRRALPR